MSHPNGSSYSQARPPGTVVPQVVAAPPSGGAGGGAAGGGAAAAAAPAAAAPAAPAGPALSLKGRIDDMVRNLDSVTFVTEYFETLAKDTSGRRSIAIKDCQSAFENFKTVRTNNPDNEAVSKLLIRFKAAYLDMRGDPKINGDADSFAELDKAYLELFPGEPLPYGDSRSRSRRKRTLRKRTRENRKGRKGGSRRRR